MFCNFSVLDVFRVLFQMRKPFFYCVLLIEKCFTDKDMKLIFRTSLLLFCIALYGVPSEAQDSIGEKGPGPVILISRDKNGQDEIVNASLKRLSVRTFMIRVFLVFCWPTGSESGLWV